MSKDTVYLLSFAVFAARLAPRVAARLRRMGIAHVCRTQTLFLFESVVACGGDLGVVAEFFREGGIPGSRRQARSSSIEEIIRSIRDFLEASYRQRDGREQAVVRIKDLDRSVLCFFGTAGTCLLVRPSAEQPEVRVVGSGLRVILDPSTVVTIPENLSPFPRGRWMDRTPTLVSSREIES